MSIYLFYNLGLPHDSTWTRFVGRTGELNVDLLVLQSCSATNSSRARLGISSGWKTRIIENKNVKNRVLQKTVHNQMSRSTRRRASARCPQRTIGDKEEESSWSTRYGVESKDMEAGACAAY